MTTDLASTGRILVVTKFRYLGDTIVATPFLRRLKQIAPRAALTLLAGPTIPSLLKGCPYVDEYWTHPGDHAGMRLNARLVSRVRAGHFGAAFLLNRSLHSALVVALARVPVRIGFQSEHRGPLLTLAVSYDGARHESDCYLDLLRAAGFQTETAPPPELWVTDVERREALDLLGPDSGVRRPLVLAQPGVKDPYRKQWDPSRLAAALGRIARQTGGSIALIGSEDEAPVCAAAAAAITQPVLNVAGRTSLRQVLALIAEADMLIANDTAMVHAAAALETPTVTVCGPQSVGKWTYGPPHRVVTSPDPPTGMRRVDRHSNRRALDAIQPDQVVVAALGILEEQRALR